MGIVRELHLLGARNIVISANIELRRDRLLYAGRRPPEDQGGAVYFTYNGSEQCIPCDKWRTIRENMRAIELTIAALRGLDRWGAKEMVNAAFWGFKALPPGGGAAFVSGQPTWHSKEAWWEVLGVSENAPKAVVRGAYRALAQKHHPDNGGEQAEFERIKRAYDAGMEAR